MVRIMIMSKLARDILVHLDLDVVDATVRMPSLCSYVHFLLVDSSRQTRCYTTLWKCKLVIQNVQQQSCVLQEIISALVEAEMNSNGVVNSSFCLVTHTQRLPQ